MSIQNQINGLKINIFVVSKFNGSHNDFFSKNGEELFQINQLGENEISSKTIKSNIQKRMKKLKFSGTQSYQGLFFKEKLNYIIHTYGDKFYVYDACDKSRGNFENDFCLSSSIIFVLKVKNKNRIFAFLVFFF